MGDPFTMAALTAASASAGAGASAGLTGGAASAGLMAGTAGAGAGLTGGATSAGLMAGSVGAGTGMAMAPATAGGLSFGSVLSGLNKGMEAGSGIMKAYNMLKPGQARQVQPIAYGSPEPRPGPGTMVDPSSGRVRVKKFSDYFREGMSDVQ